MINSFRAQRLAGFIEVSTINTATPSVNFTVPTGQYFKGVCSSYGNLLLNQTATCYVTKAGVPVGASNSTVNTSGATSILSVTTGEVTLQAGTYAFATQVAYVAGTGSVMVTGGLYYL